MTTLAELLARLNGVDPKMPLVFATADGEVGAGYHVTELRHSISKGIDCGGNVETWKDAKLQLLDGPGSTPMTVGTFTNIVQKSLSALPELRDASLMVEFGHNNEQLAIMSLHGPDISEETVALFLGDARAVCKPAIRSKRGLEDQGRCGESAVTSSQVSSRCGAGFVAQDATACCA